MCERDREGIKRERENELKERMGNKIKHKKGKGIQKEREGTFKNIEEKKKKIRKGIRSEIAKNKGKLKATKR